MIFCCEKKISEKCDFFLNILSFYHTFPLYLNCLLLWVIHYDLFGIHLIDTITSFISLCMLKQIWHSCSLTSDGNNLHCSKNNMSQPCPSIQLCIQLCYATDDIFQRLALFPANHRLYYTGCPKKNDILTLSHNFWLDYPNSKSEAGL